MQKSLTKCQFGNGQGLQLFEAIFLKNEILGLMSYP